MLLKTIENIWSPSPSPIACFCSTFGAQHQIGHMFDSHQQRDLVEIP